MPCNTLANMNLVLENPSKPDVMICDATESANDLSPIIQINQHDSNHNVLKMSEVTLNQQFKEESQEGGNVFVIVNDSPVHHVIEDTQTSSMMCNTESGCIETDLSNAMISSNSIVHGTEDYIISPPIVLKDSQQRRSSRRLQKKNKINGTIELNGQSMDSTVNPGNLYNETKSLRLGSHQHVYTTPNDNVMNDDGLANLFFSYNLRSSLSPPDDKQIVTNPFSLFSVGEQGTKRLGIWKKIPSIYSLFGIQSLEGIRRCRYVGLRNLGATCYMNSYLQTLYMNLDFRSRIFEIPRLLLNNNSLKETLNIIKKEDQNLRSLPSLSGSGSSSSSSDLSPVLTSSSSNYPPIHEQFDVIFELQLLFTALQSGMSQSADPTGVAKALRIATDYQEDATEFATLLLMTLEQQLGGTASSLNFIPKLFRGRQRQWMTCGACGNISKRTDDFYELRVQVPNTPTIITQSSTKLPDQHSTVDNTTCCLNPASSSSLVSSHPFKKKKLSGRKKPIKLDMLESFIGDPDSKETLNSMSDVFFNRQEKQHVSEGEDLQTLPDSNSIHHCVSLNSQPFIDDIQMTNAVTTTEQTPPLSIDLETSSSSLSNSIIGGGAAALSAATPIFHLESGLAHLFQSEQLKGDNKYMCNVCGEKVDAERQIFLSDLPPYLHICFERYAYDGGGRKKLTTVVDYPLTFNLKEFREPHLNESHIQLPQTHPLDNESLVPIKLDTLLELGSIEPETDDEYELIGVLEHQGSSALAGHYVAHLRDLTYDRQHHHVSNITKSIITDELLPRKLSSKPIKKQQLTLKKPLVQPLKKQFQKIPSLLNSSSQMSDVPVVPITHQHDIIMSTATTTPPALLASNHIPLLNDQTHHLSDNRPPFVSHTLNLLDDQVESSDMIREHQIEVTDSRTIQHNEHLKDDCKDGLDLVKLKKNSTRRKHTQYVSKRSISRLKGVVHKMSEPIESCILHHETSYKKKRKHSQHGPIGIDDSLSHILHHTDSNVTQQDQHEKEHFIDNKCSDGSSEDKFDSHSDSYSQCNEHLLLGDLLQNHQRKKQRYHPNHPKIVEAPGAHRTISHKGRHHFHSTHLNGYTFWNGNRLGGLYPNDPLLFSQNMMSQQQQQHHSMQDILQQDYSSIDFSPFYFLGAAAAAAVAAGIPCPSPFNLFPSPPMISPLQFPPIHPINVFTGRLPHHLNNNNTSHHHASGTHCLPSSTIVFNGPLDDCHHEDIHKNNGLTSNLIDTVYQQHLFSPPTTTTTATTILSAHGYPLIPGTVVSSPSSSSSSSKNCHIRDLPMTDPIRSASTLINPSLSVQPSMMTTIGSPSIVSSQAPTHVSLLSLSDGDQSDTKQTILGQNNFKSSSTLQDTTSLITMSTDNHHMHRTQQYPPIQCIDKLPSKTLHLNHSTGLSQQQLSSDIETQQTTSLPSSPLKPTFVGWVTTATARPTQSDISQHALSSETLLDVQSLSSTDTGVLVPTTIIDAVVSPSLNSSELKSETSHLSKLTTNNSHLNTLDIHYHNSMEQHHQSSSLTTDQDNHIKHQQCNTHLTELDQTNQHDQLDQLNNSDTDDEGKKKNPLPGTGPTSVLGHGGLITRSPGYMKSFGHYSTWVGTGNGLLGGIRSVHPVKNDVLCYEQDDNIIKECISLDSHDNKNPSHHSPLECDYPLHSQESSQINDTNMSTINIKNPSSLTESFSDTLDYNKHQDHDVQLHHTSSVVSTLPIINSQIDNPCIQHSRSLRSQSSRMKPPSTGNTSLPAAYKRKIRVIQEPHESNKDMAASLDKKWSWIQFDDATVSEWKMQNYLLPGMINHTVSNGIPDEGKNLKESRSTTHDSTFGTHRLSSSKRLSSRSAYLLIYKRKSWKPGSLIPSSNIMEETVAEMTSRLGTQQQTIVDPSNYGSVLESFINQRKIEIKGPIKNSIKQLQEYFKQQKQKYYSVTNEFPLYTHCLQYMVFVPMSWWSAFICGLDYSSLSTFLPPDIRLTRSLTNRNAAASSPLSSGLRDQYFSNNKLMNQEFILYDEILCPHYLREIELDRQPKGYWKGDKHIMTLNTKQGINGCPPSFNDQTLKETVELSDHLMTDKNEMKDQTIQNPMNYSSSIGIDPLAIWDGKVKLVPASVISNIFSTYHLAANIPHIEFCHLACHCCANAFSQLVEYWFEQRHIVQDMLQFSRTFELALNPQTSSVLSIQLNKKNGSLPTGGHFPKKIQLPSVSSSLPIDISNHDILCWISRKGLHEVDTRFTVRDRSKKQPDGIYDLYSAGEDARKEIHKLRDITRQFKKDVERETHTQEFIDTDQPGFFPIASGGSTSSDKESHLVHHIIPCQQINLSSNIMCMHNQLLPEKKPHSRILIPKEKLTRFLEIEQLKLSLLSDELYFSHDVTDSIRIIASGTVTVSDWEVDHTQYNKPLLIVLDNHLNCSKCETDLIKEKERIIEWKMRIENEKLSVGDYIYKKSCKIIKSMDSRRYASYYLCPGKHYMIPSIWITNYLNYLSAKDETTAISPGLIDGTILCTLCKCHTDHTPYLVYDPISYLTGIHSISLHPKEHTKHPEIHIYVLVHESEFDTLSNIYGSCNVPYFTVVLDPVNSSMTSTTIVPDKTTMIDDTDTSSLVTSCEESSSSDIIHTSIDSHHIITPNTTNHLTGNPPFIKYTYSIPPCFDCVQTFRYLKGGIGDFGTISLRVRIESSRIVLSRHTSRRQLFTITGDTKVEQLISQVGVALNLPVIAVNSGDIKLFLEGPVISPFYQPKDIIMPGNYSEILNGIGSRTAIIPGELWCRLSLLTTSKQALRDFHTKLDHRWFVHIIDDRGEDINSGTSSSISNHV